MSQATKFKERILQQSVGYCLVCKNSKYLNEDGSGCDCLCTEKQDRTDAQEYVNPTYANTNRDKILIDLLLAKKKLLLNGKDIKSSKQIKKHPLVKYKTFSTIFKEFEYLNILKILKIASTYKHKFNMESYNEKEVLYLQTLIQDKLFSGFKSFFENLRADILPIEDVQVIHKKYIGDLASFENLEFHPQNIEKKTLNEDESYSHIYHTHKNGWRLELYIIQNWFTSNSALSKFKENGLIKLNGLVRITNVNYKKNTMYGSPIVLGV